MKSTFDAQETHRRRGLPALVNEHTRMLVLGSFTELRLIAHNGGESFGMRASPTPWACRCIACPPPVSGQCQLFFRAQTGGLAQGGGALPACFEGDEVGRSMFTEHLNS